MVCVCFLSSWPDGLVVYITTWNIFSCSLVCPWELPQWAARRHIGACGLPSTVLLSHAWRNSQIVASFHETQSKRKNKRGLSDYLWVLQPALEGRTERSKGAQGRIMQERPENWGALNKPIGPAQNVKIRSGESRSLRKAVS